MSNAYSATSLLSNHTLNYDNVTDLSRRRIRIGKAQERQEERIDQPLDDVVEATRVDDPGAGFYVLEVTFPYRNHRSIYVHNNRDRIYKIVDDDGLGLSEVE
jgi:hypothetical protein